ncbi:MAG: type II toxin-antitoxin system HigB family toxin [Saprospiraceae bacterium]|nr:type II toxin-antitoxin system HigB family toxin [Saprospiraceae bacterium]
MRLANQKLLIKHLRKNKVNRLLEAAVRKLIEDFESNEWKSPKKLLKSRNDADKVHPDGFYFFNLTEHRTMILIEFGDSESTVVWCGDHKSYELTFKNNKNTIGKWLKTKNWI